MNGKSEVVDRFGEQTAEAVRQTWLMMLGRVSLPSYKRRMEKIGVRWIEALTYVTLDTTMPREVTESIAKEDDAA